MDPPIIFTKFLSNTGINQFHEKIISMEDDVKCQVCQMRMYLPYDYFANGNDVTLCDDCYILYSGHTDCEKQDCRECLKIAKTIKNRWKIATDFISGTFKMADKIDHQETNPGMENGGNGNSGKFQSKSKSGSLSLHRNSQLTPKVEWPELECGDKTGSEILKIHCFLNFIFKKKTIYSIVLRDYWKISNLWGAYLLKLVFNVLKFIGFIFMRSR